ncbi:hypothetical protein LTR91_000271 [Friedmanniomyces endolithicus]|uniref:Uncharacterized protein n=1 Tax=Friedmanniomyces endolithicus TaxID=329885 RepID=A0AAN6L433_9PEZI|nr:hypothetical protein LTR82_011670 [Friedmanniomyces endolithicus]KAK1010471.1 hypothetical protein LTR54_005426 [Friedmanniomyces endolithicus]KAK1016251.1 hypothetical protein LTR91_000271 [Friedmanniomyces endolithicus]KAK1054646.1 hypothetical protein LTS16_000291 [Friedmanniomyces endolithicus]
MPGEDGHWMLDLQLMHHYLTHTKYILTEHQDMVGLYISIVRKSLAKTPRHIDHEDDTQGRHGNFWSVVFGDQSDKRQNKWLEFFAALCPVMKHTSEKQLGTETI